MKMSAYSVDDIIAHCASALVVVGLLLVYHLVDGHTGFGHLVSDLVCTVVSPVCCCCFLLPESSEGSPILRRMSPSLLQYCSFCSAVPLAGSKCAVLPSVAFAVLILSRRLK